MWNIFLGHYNIKDAEDFETETQQSIKLHNTLTLFSLL